MAKPPISADELRYLMKYDPNTGLFTRLVDRGYACKAGQIAGTVTAHGYVAIGIGGRYYKGHRLAWLYVHGEWPPSEIDHLNRIKTDNRIENLMPKSRSENTLNVVSARATNKLGVLGVSKVGSRFIARLQNRYLGIFKTPKEASDAYWQAKSRLKL